VDNFIVDLLLTLDYYKAIMNINAQSTCIQTVSTTDCTYSGSIDSLQVSIPMLEAMGLIFLWIVVAICVATLIKKFS